MLLPRLIPVLQVRRRGLVKSRQFKRHSYVGDPINALRIFNEKEVDEIAVIDIEATRGKSGPDFAFIGELASECFMPLMYGGGIGSVDQAARLFDLGVEKVAIQTAALKDVRMVEAVANKFGSQSVVASVDVLCKWWSGLRLYRSVDAAVQPETWQSYVQRVVAAGAGEVMLTAVHRDGEMSGMDYDLIKEASSLTVVPLIALGGVGSFAHVSAGIEAGASAIGAASFCVYHGPHRAVLITYPSRSDLDTLR